MLVVQMIRTGLLLLCNVVPSGYACVGKARLCAALARRMCCRLVALLSTVITVGACLHKVYHGRQSTSVHWYLVLLLLVVMAVRACLWKVQLDRQGTPI